MNRPLTPSQQTCPISRRGALLRLGALFGSCVVAGSGCAGYRFGARTLYPPDIQTVYVPVFESDSFRPFLAEFLTEAVAKEIENRTPYKVVGTPEADSVLSGKITTDTKRVIIEDAYDYPRETQINMSVEVTWVDRKGDRVMQPMTMAVPPEIVLLSGDGALVPEFGQSVSTAQLQSIQRLASQIVSLMEMPW